MKIFLLLFFLVLSSISISFSQINAYAKVSAITGTNLTVANVNQTYHSFAVGEWVVIMQMQDNVIGANTADNANFGNLSAISSAGLYEIRQIVSINGNSTLGFTAVTPTTVIVNVVTNTYNINVNSSVQMISFRQMALGNYTTTADIIALDWDGNVGGVIAFEVPGILTLNHNVNADGNGFRGGAASTNLSGAYCQAGPYRDNNGQLGWKGEGVYKSVNNLYNNSRAKILNGGGGGGNHNGGGGGGGNYSGGGIGGNGFSTFVCPANTTYGQGGIDLSAFSSGSRVFMGGGGGGGQGNDGVTTPGGDGGGIILIKADEIVTTGSCAGRTITANGLDALSSGNDGSGGGGAAGTIVFFVDTWSVGVSCDLIIESNGGDGGTVVHPSSHGGGGAGAQGVIVFNGAQPTTNITVTTLNGNPGCNNDSNPCNNLAGSASGTNNSGILVGTGSPLPIQLLYFDAELLSSRKVELKWATSSEINNDYFEVQKSMDGIKWEAVSNVPGAGNSSLPLNYTSIDFSPAAGLSYYRLKQVDFDGKISLSNTRSVFNVSDEIDVFPNPTTNVIRFVGVDFKNDGFEITDLFGRNVTNQFSILGFEENTLDLDASSLASGTYVLISADKKERFVKMD